MERIKNIFDTARLLETLASCSSDAIAIKDLDHRYLYANKRFARLLGVDHNTLTGSTDDEAGVAASLIAGTDELAGLQTLDTEALAGFAVAAPQTQHDRDSTAYADPCTSTQADTRIQRARIQQINGQQVATTRSRLPDATGKCRDIHTIRAPLAGKDGMLAGLLIHSIELTDTSNQDNKLAEQTKIVQTTVTKMALHAIDTELSRLSARNDLLSSLNSITVQLVNRTELKPLLKHIAQEIKSLFNADLVHINMLHESGKFLEAACMQGEWLNDRQFRYHYGEGANGLAWKTREVQYIDDYQAFADKLEGLEDLECCAAIPICRNEKVIGTIDIAFKKGTKGNRPSAIDNPDVINQLSQLTTVALENASLHEATMATLAKTSALNELSKLIHNNSDITEVLQQSSETILNISDAVMVSILELSSDGLRHEHTVYRTSNHTVESAGNEPCKTATSDADKKATGNGKTVFAADRSEPGVIQPGLVTPTLVTPALVKPGGPVIPALVQPGPTKSALINHSAAQWCFNHNTPVVIRQNEVCQHKFETVKQWQGEPHCGASLYLPLIQEDDTYGVLAIHRHQDQRDFSEAELNLLQIAGNQVSIAIHQSALLAKIKHDAYHDGLTQLPNRIYFEKRLAESIERKSTPPAPFAVLFMDLDGFKSVNDTLGHGVGDKLLRSVSDRLAASIREGDLLVRLGGDEFAVLLHNLDNRATAVNIADRLNQSLQSTIEIDGYKITISVSIGLSFYPTDGYTAEELLKNADIAMYQAKGNGKNCINCFDEQMALKYQERVRLESDLREAVKTSQLYIEYQPQIDPNTGRVVAVEALARWNHPTLGAIPPDKFIPVAEESGLITLIGERVLREACKQTRIWQQQGFRRLQVAVNISAQQFTQDDFESAVFDALASSGLKPGFLELEITENIVMENVSRVVTKLNKLRDKGIQIALDDFGTGYSSLRYLGDLPVDTLKIDRSFVNKLNHNDPQHSLVNTIILMASSFGITTVAEGVETKKQLRSVTQLGCDYIQGYYFSKPVSAESLPSVINRINNASNTTALAA